MIRATTHFNRLGTRVNTITKYIHMFQQMNHMKHWQATEHMEHCPSLCNKTHLTPINVTELPLSSMQILGNKLLRRPELIVILSRNTRMNVVSKLERLFQQPNGPMTNPATHQRCKAILGSSARNREPSMRACVRSRECFTEHVQHSGLPSCITILHHVIFPFKSTTMQVSFIRLNQPKVQHIN
jgi:hypothetical protein